MKTLVPGPGAVAIVDDHDRWLLLVAAPEIARHELLDGAAADGRLTGIVLLDAQLEQGARLAALSRTRPLALYATPGVFEALTARLSMVGAGLHWHPLPIAGDVRSAGFDVEGMASLHCVAVDADEEADEKSRVGERLALFVEDRSSGQRLAWSLRQGAQLDGLEAVENMS